MTEEQTEIQTPIGSIKASGRDVKLLFIIATFVSCALLLWVMWHHTMDAKAEAKVIEARMEQDSKALSSAINNLARSQREMACVISLPMEKREREYMSADSYCRRLSSMQ